MSTPPFLPLPPAPAARQRTSALPTTTLPPVAPPVFTPPVAEARPQFVIWIPREGWPADLSHLSPDRPVRWKRDGQDFDTREEADAAFAVDPIANTPSIDEPEVDPADENAMDALLPDSDEPTIEQVIGEEGAAQVDAHLAKTVQQPTPDEIVREADKPMRTARRGAARKAAKDQPSAAEAGDPRAAAQAALDDAVANAESARLAHDQATEAVRIAAEKAEAAWRAMDYATKLADWAQHHPALQES